MRFRDRSIYLDHNATTPVDPAAAEAMRPFMGEEFGNPSSPYPLGVRAKESLEKARKEVALLLGSKAHEIVFTSGGSESNNAVLKGCIDFRHPEDFHLVILRFDQSVGDQIEAVAGFQLNRLLLKQRVREQSQRQTTRLQFPRRT